MKKGVMLFAILTFLIACNTPKNSVSETVEIKEKAINPKFDLEKISGDYVVSEMTNLQFSGIIPTIRIEPNGNISGNNGCNTYFGRINPSAANCVDKLGSTRMACQGKASEVERAFMGLMREVDRIARYGNEIQFLAEGKLILVAKELVLEGKFVVTSVGNEYVENRGISFTVHEGKIVGTTGCNSFFGEIEQKGRDVNFKGVGATEKACLEFDSAMESRFLKALSKTSYYLTNEDKIQFYLGIEQLFTVRKILEK